MGTMTRAVALGCSENIGTKEVICIIVYAVYPVLHDERGGAPRCFSKPPHSKYARVVPL